MENREPERYLNREYGRRVGEWSNGGGRYDDLKRGKYDDTNTITTTTTIITIDVAAVDFFLSLPLLLLLLV